MVRDGVMGRVEMMGGRAPLLQPNGLEMRLSMRSWVGLGVYNVLPCRCCLLGWDSMARKIYAPVVKSTWLSQISVNLRQFLVLGTCLKIKY